MHDARGRTAHCCSTSLGCWVGFCCMAVGWGGGGVEAVGQRDSGCPSHVAGRTVSKDMCGYGFQGLEA